MHKNLSIYFTVEQRRGCVAPVQRVLQQQIHTATPLPKCSIKSKCSTQSMVLLNHLRNPTGCRFRLFLETRSQLLLLIFLTTSLFFLGTFMERWNVRWMKLENRSAQSCAACILEVSEAGAEGAAGTQASRM